MTSVELLLHPIRLRIVQAFLGERSLTTAQLRAELPDVPAASLYRHVARLVAHGVLAVTTQRQVRGAVERTYVLRPVVANAALAGQLAAMSAEDHRHAFMAFIAGLLGDFDRYLARGDVDFVRDGVGYQVTGLWLDNAEFRELAHALAALFQPWLSNRPRPGRTRRLLATVVLPGEESPSRS